MPNKEEMSLERQHPCILPFLLGLPWLCRPVANCFSEAEDNPIDHDEAYMVCKLSNHRLGPVHSCLLQHSTNATRLNPDPRVAANIEMCRPPGTVILVHAFGEPILKEHLQFFNWFYRQANLHDWWRPGFGKKTFNRELFRKFWADKKRDNDIPEVDLTDIPSPYAWLDKPRQEDKYVEGFAQFERMLADAVTDVYFDNVFRGGKPNPWAGGTGDWSEYFDPLN